MLQVDNPVIQGQGVLPVSLSITDPFGNVADPNLAAQVLQGLEGKSSLKDTEVRE